MMYGYARVSTAKQLKDGNSLEAQCEQLRKAGCTEIVQEQYTGAKTDRPKFNKLLEELKTGDELVVCKLDRLARNTAEGSSLIKTLTDNGIIVNVLNMGRADNTSPMGMLMVNILLSFAEFERAMIIERTQQGKEIAKQREGYREGRPKLSIDISEQRKAVSEGKITVVEACKQLGISRRSWYNLIA